jgi:hypothetical protein
LIFKYRFRIDWLSGFEDLPREQAKGNYMQEAIYVNRFFQGLQFIFAHSCLTHFTCIKEPQFSRSWGFCQYWLMAKSGSIRPS